MSGRFLNTAQCPLVIAHYRAAIYFGIKKLPSLAEKIDGMAEIIALLKQHR